MSELTADHLWFKPACVGSGVIWQTWDITYHAPELEAKIKRNNDIMLGVWTARSKKNKNESTQSNSSEWPILPNSCKTPDPQTLLPHKKWLSHGEKIHTFSHQSCPSDWCVNLSHDMTSPKQNSCVLSCTSVTFPKKVQHKKLLFFFVFFQTLTHNCRRKKMVLVFLHVGHWLWGNNNNLTECNQVKMTRI